MLRRWLRGLWSRPAATGAWAVEVRSSEAMTLWRPLGTAGRPPVVLYLPGWNGRRADNACLLAELASHGFAVAALDDPQPGGAMDFRDEAAQAATLRRITARLAASVAAVRRLLDALARDGLDVERAGIVGYSFGGAAAAEASVSEPRLAGVVNLDGWLFGRAARDGVACPYLLLSDGTPAPTAAHLTSARPAVRLRALRDAADLRQQAVQFATLGGWHVTLRGTTHDCLSDARLHAPLRRLRGPDPIAVQQILAACCLAFFRHVLLGEGPALADLRRWPAARVDAAVPPDSLHRTLRPVAARMTVRSRACND
jgi:dienelactone hydrolase